MGRSRPRPLATTALVAVVGALAFATGGPAGATSAHKGSSKRDKARPSLPRRPTVTAAALARAFRASSCLAISLLALGVVLSATRAAGAADAARTAHRAHTCKGVSVRPGTSLQAAIDRRRSGTTFCIKRGVHRQATYVVAKDGDTFVGEPGAVLNGSRLLTSFTRVGPLWVASLPSAVLGGGEGECAERSPNCRYPNDVFVDDRPLRRADDLARLEPLGFYIDDVSNKLYLAQNPAGHRVEMAVAGMAFKGWQTGVTGVTIRGLVIEKFANPAGIGAVNGRPTWRVIENTIRLNHGIGVQDASVIRNNRIVKNGQLGVMVSFGSQVLIERNTIAANNYAGFDPSWEVGGVKFVRSDHVILRRNRVVGNFGPGLWADGSDIHITYEKNVITGNSGPGILHEISYDAVIKGNVVSRNGFGSAGWIDGAGILLNSSGNVKISGNVVSRNRDGIGITQTDRGSGPRGPHQAQNNLVVGNVITMAHGHTGLVKNVGDDSYYTTKRNVFDRNTYHLGCDAQYFAWRDPSGRRDYVYMTRRQWQAGGNDRNGRFHSTC